MHNKIAYFRHILYELSRNGEIYHIYYICI